MPDQSQADIFVQGGGVPAAGHPSNNLSVFLDFIVRPGDASPDHLKFYQQALRPRLALPDQGLLADEGWLAQLDKAAEPGFQGGDVPVDLVAVEGEFGFKSQGVPGAQADGGNPARSS